MAAALLALVIFVLTWTAGTCARTKNVFTERTKWLAAARVWHGAVKKNVPLMRDNNYAVTIKLSGDVSCLLLRFPNVFHF